jgi:hypothetical protein
MWDNGRRDSEGEKKCNFADPETHFSIPEIGYAVCTPDSGKSEERGMINHVINCTDHSPRATTATQKPAIEIIELRTWRKLLLYPLFDRYPAHRAG